MFYRFTATKKGSVVGGTCDVVQWENMVSRYTSLGYVVKKIGDSANA